MTNFLDSRHPSAEDILSALLAARPEPTRDAPKDRRGIYGLVDHYGDLRYIGSTKATAETLYKRIHQRHRTESENSSHYFSRMYNAGRMWRLRNDAATKADGYIAKKLRNAFVAEHCKAVWVALPDNADIAGLEQAVIRLAPKEAIAWNGRGMEAYAEPVELVHRVLLRLKFSSSELEAVNRQNARFLGSDTAPVAISSVNRSSAPVTHKVPPFPEDPFRFFALDVETANNDRGSICQIGVACVRPDNSIETWVTYVDPQANTWVFTYLHGIEKKDRFRCAAF